MRTLGTVPYAMAGFGDALAADFAGDFAKVRPFLRRDPRSEEDWNDLLKELEAHAFPRAALAEACAGALKAHGAPDEALANAKALGKANVFAVVTGQQAGLFGGPLYSLHKALTAIKLARMLTERHGPKHRFVPVFWVAGDDHDLAEIDHADFLAPNATVERLRLALPKDAEGKSACDVGAAPAAALKAELEALLPGAAAELLAAYEGSLADGFARLMLRWLGRLGLVVVASQALRALGKDLYAREVREYAKSAEAIRTAGERMAAAGYAPGFEKPAAAPNLFLKAASGNRERLDPAAHTQSEVLALIEKEPARFSAAAALRPVLQDRIFPAAAAVLGPGELSYWAQLPELHERYGAVWPMLVPRATFTVLDAQGEKALRKLDAKPHDLLLDETALKARLFAGGELGAKMDARAKRILEELAALHAEVRAVDGGLEPLFEKAKSRIENELQRIREKTAASGAQREQATAARVAYLSALCRPKGRPQERVLCTAQFLAQQPDLPEALLEQLDPFAFEHRIVAP
ncbi:MAG: bacillithiol biosynthesis cysteine-adding enzyme BshC [Planctomycetes bacterium]|nr:bacillithiol biosynthesis cysteine-adding enzyme BshC [Planctomycetota bacterium]